MKGRILYIVLVLVMATLPMAANADAALLRALEWQDIGDAAPGEAALTALVGLPTGKIVAGTIGSGIPYLVQYDMSTGTFSPKMLVPGSGAHVSRLAVGSNNEVYASTSRTFGVGNLARYQNGTIVDLGSIGDEYGEALTVGQDGRVYVATCCQGELSVYNPETQAWTYRGTIIPNQRRLSGLATASNGDIYGVSSRIWISPYGGAALYKINPANLSVTVIGTIWPGERESWNIVNNPIDHRLYGSVGYGMTARLFAYDPSQPGLGIQDLGAVPTGEDQITAGGMIVGTNGKVYAVTSPNRRLIAYDSANPNAGLVEMGLGYSPLALGSDRRFYGANGNHLLRSDPIYGILDLPFAYDNFAQTASGWTGLGRGRVYSWFDHQYPTYDYDGSPNLPYPGLLKYTGDQYATTSPGVSSYDGHDGIDFSARIGSRDVRAAAAGTVEAIYDTCNQTCYGGSCCEYLGNRVEIDHGNGYRTIYGHLEYQSIPVTVTVGAAIAQGAFLGRMGTTGNSEGPHLHFGVKTHVGNRWATVDPYGWIGTNDIPNDPWAEYVSGAASNYLWNESLDTSDTSAANHGITIGDAAGFAVVNIGPAQTGGMISATLSNTPVPPPNTSPWRNLGRFFSLLLEYVPLDAPNSALALSSPITITMPFSPTDLLHFGAPAIAVHHWNESGQLWEPLATTVDLQSGNAVAVTDQTGKFDLQAPLLCPAEVLEPDDTYDAAQSIWQNDPPIERALDVANDTDWAMFQATAGVTYTLRTQNLAPNVATVLSIYEDAELSPELIAGSNDPTKGPASELVWVAPHDGTFYFAVTPGPGSAIGCGATYELMVETIPGDVTGDCLVDVLDIQRVSEGWPTIEYQYGYVSVLDQDDDGDVDIGDIQWVAARWGQTCQ